MALGRTFKGCFAVLFVLLVALIALTITLNVLLIKYGRIEAAGADAGKTLPSWHQALAKTLGNAFCTSLTLLANKTSVPKGFFTF